MSIRCVFVQGGDQERDEKIEPPRDVEPVHPELAQQEHGTPKPRDQEGAVNALAFPVRLTLHIEKESDRAQGDNAARQQSAYTYIY